MSLGYGRPVRDACAGCIVLTGCAGDADSLGGDAFDASGSPALPWPQNGVGQSPRPGADHGQSPRGVPGPASLSGSATVWSGSPTKDAARWPDLGVPWGRPADTPVALALVKAWAEHPGSSGLGGGVPRKAANWVRQAGPCCRARLPRSWRPVGGTGSLAPYSEYQIRRERFLARVETPTPSPPPPSSEVIRAKPRCVQRD